MALKKDLNSERDQVFEGLRNVWNELAIVRELWIENPLSPILTERLRKQEDKANKSEVTYDAAA